MFRTAEPSENVQAGAALCVTLLFNLSPSLHVQCGSQQSQMHDDQILYIFCFEVMLFC